MIAIVIYSYKLGKSEMLFASRVFDMETEVIAKIPKGISLNNAQLNTIVHAYFERGQRTFSEDEIEIFHKNGTIDVTDFSKVEFSVGIGDPDW